jgi:DNA polymerase bacteriophage-type
MIDRLYLDDETYSEVPITHGTHRYAEGVEVMLRAWALNDAVPSVQDVANGEPAPKLLQEAVRAARNGEIEVWAHNSHFDRTMERWAGFEIPLSAWRDSMVQALCHGLPGALGDLCDILGVPQEKAKDKDGRALIMLFCKPRPATSKLRRATRDTHPAEWERFKSYAGLDIVAMREVLRRLPAWNYPGRELALWQLDQQINDRGVCIDIDLAEAALAAVEVAQKGLAKRTQRMTGGEVQSATQRDALLLHVLTEYGVDLPDMQMATLERRIADPDLPEGLRELLRIRLQASTTSTSKYKTLLRGVSSDGRLRGLLQFCGANRTGRWAGRLWQPQNLPRPTLPQEEIDLGIEALKDGSADLLFDNVMQLTSSAIRGCIVAPPGRKLVVADLSNIEGRDQAWLAGEDWKLQAFRDFDAGTGPDLYKMSYGKSFNVAPEDVTKEQRQVGKVQELALGYEGGVGAFVTFAAAYNIDLDELAARAVKFIPNETWGQANIMLQWHREHKRDPAADMKMPDRTWLVCESFKLGWRQAHPAIAAGWKQLDALVRAAIDEPGRTFQWRYVKIRRDGAWLRIVLPSGRALCYPSPKVGHKEDCAECLGTGSTDELTECPACEGSGVSGKNSKSITYMGVNQYSRKWSRLHTYGGKLFENICQAVARDVMAENMPAIEAAGYQIVLTVHDEVICEAPDEPEYNAEHLSGLLATNPSWAPDMPLAAAGFETYRYKKD